MHEGHSMSKIYIVALDSNNKYSRRYKAQSLRFETDEIDSFFLNTLLDKYIPRGRSANGTRGPMRGTPPVRHITHRTYKRK